MSRFWSPVVDTLSPYVPGEQPTKENFVKLNTNESPYGPSDHVLNAIHGAVSNNLRRYPDPSADAIRQSIAKGLGLEKSNIFVGNGSDEILSHAFNAFFSGKPPVLFPEITYSFYHACCQLYGVRKKEIPLDMDFRIDVHRFEGVSGGVVVANPNAPTGIALELPEIETILRSNPDVVVLVDEAYVDFGASSSVNLVPQYDNLIVVQTFSKSRSLAGLRFGMAVGHPDLIDALTRVKDSFNSYPLDSLALAGAQAAWEDTVWFEKVCQKVIADRSYLSSAMEEMDFKVLPSSANFIFVAHPVVSAQRLLVELRKRGILVRHFNDERIKDWLRISVGTTNECAALLVALKEILITKSDADDGAHC
jgi:histidinol-phosphate aminotransferase